MKTILIFMGMISLVYFGGVNALIESEDALDLFECLSPCLKENGELCCDGRGEDLGHYTWLLDRKIPIQKAQRADLVRVHGIGEKKAEIIYKYIQQNSVAALSQLNRIHGIGEKKVAQLSEHYCIDCT